MIKQNKTLLSLLFSILGIFILSGFIIGGLQETLQGFFKIQLHPARLINDFVEIAGIGPTLLNSALVGLIGLLLILKNDVKVLNVK